jgi:hypothetical protein
VFDAGHGTSIKEQERIGEEVGALVAPLAAIMRGKMASSFLLDSASHLDVKENQE